MDEIVRADFFIWNNKIEMNKREKEATRPRRDEANIPAPQRYSQLEEGGLPLAAET